MNETDSATELEEHLPQSNPHSQILCREILDVT